MYLRIFILVIVVYVFWYVYRFISLNRKELSLIFKRGKFFYSNPYVKQEIVTSTSFLNYYENFFLRYDYKNVNNWAK